MVCRVLAKDPELMVAKGLSWALRTLVPVDRDGVESFMGVFGKNLPSLVRREVKTKLDTGKKNPNR